MLALVAACSDDPAQTAKPTESTKVVGYFTNWGVYDRNFQVKDLDTDGAAGKLTHLLYAFGTVKDGKCAATDAWADYQKPITAAASVDGAADAPDAPLRGNFGQLRKLKKKYPQLKVVWSFGGWNDSGGFTTAAKDPAAFADSCRQLLDDSRWKGVFDGVDVDWEYPNACGLTCDKSGPDGLAKVLTALRSALGKQAVVTAAVPADVEKLKASDYQAAAAQADWLGAMTYDYFGTGGDGDANGADAQDEHHTALQSPLSGYSGIPRANATTTATIDQLLSMGVPPAKILLGVPFYGRGWTGVSSAAPGGTASGPAKGKYETGLEDYAILADRCPPTGDAGGTAYGHCGSEWWSYDTPDTIKAKMSFAASKSLGGAFAWELSGDTAKGDLLNAVVTGMGR
ncbi:glycoside hydrolase family 18 protein [Actinoplanes sp. TBRC 11911]|uniref:glycoside hydrolase family 18 protein n=1 Tax=Actinoplanes sp. TBRC 11911 TaxID=2729386 RepID=UPI00200718C3|nr:glycoside hydrolase family 18 protein [Actinoplanes sp. TBRC 11911]